MTRHHLRAVPDRPKTTSAHTTSPSEGATAEWIVRVWYATEETFMDDLLAEGIVPTLDAAAQYATTTQAAHRARNGYIWVQAIPGHTDDHGQWQSSGPERRATFSHDLLGPWLPATRRT